MYQNYTIGQTEFVLNYNYDLPQNHVARLISDFVDSIPQDVLLEDSGAATGRPSSHPAIMLKILLFAYVFWKKDWNDVGWEPANALVSPWLYL